MYFYINGSYLEEEQAKISVLDLGLIRGYGVFDYLRTYNGQPFHLQEHLERLKYSADKVGICLPYTLEEIKNIVGNLLRRGGYLESNIKILVTGGKSLDQLLPQEASTFIAYVYPQTLYPSCYYSAGIHVITTSLSRSISSAKTLQYLPAIIALKEGREKNAQEALYLNARREILEATTSNFFAFKGNTLITCFSDEILLGITREVVLRLAELHFTIDIRPISYQEIVEFDEAFLTASNKEVLPIVKIDDYVVGNGKVGENTLKLMKAFQNYTKQGNWPYLSIPRHTNPIYTQKSPEQDENYFCLEATDF